MMLRYPETEHDRPAAAAVAPRTDLVETPENFLLYMDLPGVPRERVRIRMKDGMLTVTGIPRQDQAGDRKVIRRESGQAPFHRHVRLSDHLVNTDGISAHMKNGVLSVTIPKRSDKKNRRRRIPVRRRQ